MGRRAGADCAPETHPTKDQREGSCGSARLVTLVSDARGATQTPTQACIALCELQTHHSRRANQAAPDACQARTTLEPSLQACGHEASLHHQHLSKHRHSPTLLFLGDTSRSLLRFLRVQDCTASTCGNSSYGRTVSTPLSVGKVSRVFVHPCTVPECIGRTTNVKLLLVDILHKNASHRGTRSSQKSSWFKPTLLLKVRNHHKNTLQP